MPPETTALADKRGTPVTKPTPYSLHTGLISQRQKKNQRGERQQVFPDTILHHTSEDTSLLKHKHGRPNLPQLQHIGNLHGTQWKEKTTCPDL
ncbi:Hypothetical predicted protein [Pelobates cultripes]|uniref:Uncharacterized protein n=1 Tax=Pelobates cultripes TaxID=61616 RepID=A0AAD1W4X5_PELCU|nr:Hypothetical predicted protein [Pelobates cultripes]